MSVFSLKLLAMASMICDHLGFWLYLERLTSYSTYTAMRSFGRLAFPIFCFLIVNGYEHSSDRKGYLTRLTGFALLSQIPFTLTFCQSNYSALIYGSLAFQAPTLTRIMLCLLIGLLWYGFVRADFSALLPAAALFAGLSSLHWGSVCLLRPDMNVFYTLALSLAMLCVLDEFLSRCGSFPKSYARAATVLLALLLVWEKADYGVTGIILIILLWFFRRCRWQQLAMIVIWSFAQYSPFSTSGLYFFCAAAAVLPLAFYNEKPGKKLKTAFYLVYPLHLLALGLMTIC